jgi:microcystin-dependent protein
MTDGRRRFAPAISGTRILRAMSVDVALLPAVGDAITTLTESWGWMDGDGLAADVVEEMIQAVDTWYTPMIIGQIAAFLGDVPAFWLQLDGATHDQADYPELAGVLDPAFKDDPAGTFTLPDLAGRFLMAVDVAGNVGDTGGLDAVTLTPAEMPAHNHQYEQPITLVDIGGAGPPVPAISATNPAAQTGSAGGDQAHENRPPFLAVNYAILAGRDYG